MDEIPDSYSLDVYRYVSEFNGISLFEPTTSDIVADCDVMISTI